MTVQTPRDFQVGERLTIVRRNYEDLFEGDDGTAPNGDRAITLTGGFVVGAEVEVRRVADYGDYSFSAYLVRDGVVDTVTTNNMNYLNVVPLGSAVPDPRTTATYNPVIHPKGTRLVIVRQSRRDVYQGEGGTDHARGTTAESLNSDYPVGTLVEVIENNRRETGGFYVRAVDLSTDTVADEGAYNTANYLNAIPVEQYAGKYTGQLVDMETLGKKELRDFVETIRAELLKEAEDRSWCAEFDQVMRRIGLADRWHGLPRTNNAVVALKDGRLATITNRTEGRWRVFSLDGSTPVEENVKNPVIQGLIDRIVVPVPRKPVTPQDAPTT